MSSLNLQSWPTHAVRRTVGGARRALSVRVSLHGASGKFDGWTLNISRGGLRVIVEEPVRVDERFDLSLLAGGPSGADQVCRQGRVVWTQSERDGTIAGFEFLAP